MSEKTDTNVEPPSDEELRKLLKPEPTNEQVLQILKDHYCETDDSLVAVLEQLDSYDDCNYMVEIDGKISLLKIHNGVESKDFIACLNEANGNFYKDGHMKSVIHLQNAILELFAERHISSSVPIKPRATHDKKLGSPVVVTSLPVVSQPNSPCDLVVRLLSWVPGRPLSSVMVYSMEVLADAGRFLGMIDKTLDQLSFNSLTNALEKVGSSAALLSRASFTRGTSGGTSDGLGLLGLSQPKPRSSSMDRLRTQLGLAQPETNVTAQLDESILVAARRYHQWDGKNTADLRKFVHCIDDEKRRSLVVSVLDAFEHDIIKSGVGEQFRKGVNHGDFNDANILVNPELRVSGVIDFGDSVESWRVLELSTALAYAMVSNYGKKNRALSAAAGMLRGYNAVYPVAALERKHLRLLMACRLACSVTLGAYSYQQNPLNRYLLYHAEPAWKSLELLWGFDVDGREKMGTAVNRLFDQACLYSDPRERIVTCYDLVIPDPGVADLLQSVRTQTYDATSEPPRKKQKTTDGIPVITFVTGNRKKLEEVQRILKPTGTNEGDQLMFQLTNQKVDLPELQGEPIAIAREKCLTAAQKLGCAVITEDTSLCFNALNGLPGPYIKWFLESCGHDGLNKMIGAFDDKSAYAQTVVSFCPGPGHDPIIFDGRTSGKIVPARGSLDFGWDPVFEPDEGNGKTYAQMTKAEKDAISHRSRAFKQLSNYMNKFHADILSKIQ